VTAIRFGIGTRDVWSCWATTRIQLAQGACMAIEDGLCLADCIAAANSDYAAAFWRYENARAVRNCARDARIPLHLGGLSFGRHHARSLLADARRTRRSRPLQVPRLAL
jgi:2-polyprenyl-6-methoxyphenol hydroxylase-like FAD-dependent oxidoreductase